MIKDGYVHTGDKGYYDEDERLFIVGRYKELIKYGVAHVCLFYCLIHHNFATEYIAPSIFHTQVVPTNVEKQMMTHPAVKEVGVVGLPDEVFGELPLAFVVLREGATATAEELINYTNSNNYSFE